MTETNRLETFSDGVFAIAITLLVLAIDVPSAEQPLGLALVEQVCPILSPTSSAS